MVRTFLAPWAVFVLIYFTIGVLGHMSMVSPAPINHKNNPFAGKIDSEYNNPLSASGSDFPCKGQHTLLDPSEGQPVAQWEAGQSYSMTIDGGAFHLGGSCQASLSFDGGQTFKVIHSYVGGCPSANGETSYSFTVPEDTPSAERAIFAWSWFNKIGNREMYMNCAVVSISGGGGGLDDRPDMFVANVGNGCSTAETYDVAFPDPGAEVTVQGSNTAPPTGNCGSGPGLTNPGGQRGSDGTSEHRPGNDWPDWYNHAERLRPCVLNIILGQLGMFGVPYVARFFAV
ncbi:hypothetical protein B0T11DRAFT_326848 [Plectosphaerella cucumerina]|uniref:Lytic polysaccharide monooxygenase n=1 Tax=Plectosphaerella cucumerina TaxID=40658 RepID=A0A8K0X6A9_9PEZI|nr:hypothetical protein B0T11DRAFT_326848 [Plectosphaerella cucumerina]